MDDETLEKQPIELRRVAGEPGQEGVDLPAVMGLKIEPVRHGGAPMAARIAPATVSAGI
jgi:hypothetical protein